MTPTPTKAGVIDTLREDLRIPKRAIPDTGNFDPTRLPHIWVDNRLRMLGLITTLVGGCSALMGWVILWESRAGARHLRMDAIPGEAIAAWTIGAALLGLGIWWLARRDIIVIDDKGVKVREYRLGHSRSWELPLSAYRGMALIRDESVREADSDLTWTSWSVILHHDDARRSVVLYSRRVIDHEGTVYDHNNRLTKEGASTCETRATAHAISWAEAMEIPMLIERDGELVEKDAPPALAWMPTF